MIISRPAAQRGYADHGWLQTYHSFSFADYHDPEFTHFSDLRVINEDIVAPGKGFAMHPHRNMEILTYVLSGHLAHEDNLGHQGRLAAGEWQMMSAGSGIRHSESNPDAQQPLHLLQIWLFPNELGLTPHYAQRRFADKSGACLICSPDGSEGSFLIRQDARLWRWQLAAGEAQTLSLAPQRRYWLHMVQGRLSVNDHALSEGDALGIQVEEHLHLAAHKDCEFLLFDLR